VGDGLQLGGVEASEDVGRGHVVVGILAGGPGSIRRERNANGPYACRK
jgi:hypothetical protein